MPAVWIIEWDYGVHERYKIEEPLYILPWRRTNAQVTDFMRNIYYNCMQIHCYSETLSRINSKKPPQPMVSHEGPRILFGDNPFLVASSVKDLVITHDPERQIEILEWTRPAGLKIDRDTLEQVTMGEPFRRKVERSIE